ncbi:hypothetical protein K469DRAFT_695853 [Zopfia rhizophila CBS 207.26]|uniref:Uncharacterized protein n=1 Tax=Zopfia rhizophila CBS 207.26 TaxID=1314779 RepID=A0A6A6EL88_9PEZI|nr:hypothetical protein K469DRAFT_695853 [Zopfia rhizophila CBS 207.26]
MRPSPHLHTSQVVQQRDMQGRNEQSQAHNANFAYSNPQTPSELHPAQSAHQHIRGQSIAEQFRAQNSRDHEFDARNRERDIGRDLSHRADVLREPLLSNSQHRTTAAPVPSHQDLRYQIHPQQDRGYDPPGSHTPFSRSEHPQHPSLQHAHHSLLVDNDHAVLGQRQQDGPTSQQHRHRDERERLADRIHEGQAHQQARMRGDEYVRELDARYREELIRRERDARYPGPTPPAGPVFGQHGQEQAPESGGPRDWASAVRPEGRWRRDEYMRDS